MHMSSHVNTDPVTESPVMSPGINNSTALHCMMKLQLRSLLTLLQFQSLSHRVSVMWPVSVSNTYVVKVPSNNDMSDLMFNDDLAVANLIQDSLHQAPHDCLCWSCNWCACSTWHCSWCSCSQYTSQWRFQWYLFWCWQNDLFNRSLYI